jgi:hypothetical protein
MSAKTFTVQSVSMQRLFRWFDQQCLAVPEIQREFVWNAQRACALLDSIYKGYPIGTAMIWRTGKENQWLLRPQLHVLPVFDQTRNRDILFLIDGQQRLSVLHQLRRGETIYNSNGREIRFGDIYFSLAEEETHFLYLRRPDPAVHFKVMNILSDRWRQMFGKLPAYKLRAIKECRQRLLRYTLVFVVTKARELADVRETFLRINTQGMRITEADRAFSSASKVRPLQRFRHLCETLPQGYGAINKAVYWTTLVLIRGIQDLGQKAFARLTKEIERDEDGRLWFERHEPRVAESIKLACDYLIGQLRVFDFKLLPYENMIAVLAVFFFWNNRAQPNRVQRDQIRRWFWHTAVLKRYAGSGYRPNILADVAFFQRLGRSRKGNYPATERAPAASLIMEDYSGTSALSRAFKLLLLAHKPRYITNGEEMPVGPVASSRNAKELHHIWPRDLLGKNGIAKKRFNALANMCYLVAHDNRSFGAKPPHRYLAEFRTPKHFARAMRSHLIPHERTSALWFENVPRGFKAFLEERRAILVRAFNEAAGMRLFET